MSIQENLPNRKVSPKFQYRINQIIKETGLNKYKYAKKVHIDRNTITRAAIYGIPPSVPILMKLADFHKISLAYLLGDSDDEDEFCEASPRSTYHIRIVELCEEKKVKFSQIGYHVSFPYSYFYDWQREKILPTLEKLDSIAAYFKVSLDYLLGRSDDKKPNTNNSPKEKENAANSQRLY